MEKRFPRRLSALDGVFRFTAEFAADCGLSAANSLRLQLVLEELFVNCVEHGVKRSARAAGDEFTPGDEIAVSLVHSGDEIAFAVTDFDVEAFDPLSVAPPDVAAPLSARRPGGLGIYLVRQLARQLRCDYSDGVLAIRGSIAPGE